MFNIENLENGLNLELSGETCKVTPSLMSIIHPAENWRESACWPYDKALLKGRFALGQEVHIHLHEEPSISLVFQATLNGMVFDRIELDQEERDEQDEHAATYTYTASFNQNDASITIYGSRIWVRDALAA